MRAAVLVLLLCLGCGGPALQQAEHSARLRLYNATGLAVRSGNVHWAPAPLRCDTIPDAVACCTVANGRVRVNVRLRGSAHTAFGAARLERVLLHELAHRLTKRTDHAPQGQGLLGPRESAANPRLTRADLDWICGAVSCRWRRPEKSP